MLLALRHGPAFDNQRDRPHEPECSVQVNLQLSNVGNRNEKFHENVPVQSAKPIQEASSLIQAHDWRRY